MASKRGTFDPSFGGHDERLAQVLQSGEVVTSSSFGALLVPFGRGPFKAKVYVTTLRLAVVPDDARLTPVWSEAWNKITGVRVKKSLISATAFIEVNDTEIGVDSTKSMAGDIERAWLHLRAVSPTFESCGVKFLPTVDVRCSACGSQVPPANPQCGMCLRQVVWPPPLDTLSAGMVNPDSFLPMKFPNGDDTQRGAVIAGLAVLTFGAVCIGQKDFLAQSSLLIEAIRDKVASDPDDFGNLPILKAVGDQGDNEKFWQMVCCIPQRLVVQ
jgi:hypothetical protein